MAVYDLRGLDTDFVVVYGSDEAQINAYTFANSLIALSNALQAINREVNPDYTLEISVAALGGGSFRPQIRARAKRLAKLLFSDFRNIIVQVAAAVIAHRLLGTDPAPRIEINADQVIIYSESGDTLILPQETYDTYRHLKDDPEISTSLEQTFDAIQEDEAVTSFGFARSPEERENLPLQLNKTQIADLARPRVLPVPGQREIIEQRAQLTIVRAIFEDSARRWQFVWNGIRISAPLMDVAFRRRIIAREISITHGDIFVADLRIIQSDDGSGIWINRAYEIMTVYEHRTSPTQPGLV